jgi:hypothetical protein
MAFVIGDLKVELNCIVDNYYLSKVRPSLNFYNQALFLAAR